MGKQVKFGELNCPKCGEKQWSISDNKYVKLFGHCWGCDKKLWEEKKLTTEEFERREKMSIQ
jgi:hypothetical protein